MDLPKDLWEIAYALSLFRRYFPGALFLPLFKEAGINPRMIERAIDIFARQGIIDFRFDPLPRIPGFIAQAERVLGRRKEPIRYMVWTRILAWVNSGKFRPCFNILDALADLGGEGSDSLMLDSLIGDLVNNTYRGLEEAIESGRFAAVTGPRRFPLLLYIFNTFKALIHQGEAEIRQAFQDPAPEADSIPAYKAQIFANLAGYHFGVQDIPAASEVVKEAMLLSQNQQEGRGLAQSYRLFSLVNISKQRMGDAIDYFTFAIENAERTGYPDELAVSAYYAAGTH
jgi:tetratricopeptide (TPR) repeat protein